MTPVWAQRREELLSDCMVSPDVFHQMVDRLGAFVVPYQQALETEAGQRNVHLYLQGCCPTCPARMLRTSRRSSMSNDRSCKHSLAPRPGTTSPCSRCW